MVILLEYQIYAQVPHEIAPSQTPPQFHQGKDTILYYCV